MDETRPEPAAPFQPGAADEARHLPLPVPGWSEWWSFDACAPDGSAGLFVRLALHPAQRRCTYWAGLVGAGRPYLLVRDDDLELPPEAAGLEVRGSLWAACTCEAPGSHWTLGLESWAVAFARGDELDAWGAERGGREGLALDLSFEDEPERGGGTCLVDEGWWRAGLVWGEVLVGSGSGHEEVVVEAWPAVRRHCWGPPGATSWSWRWPPAGPALLLEHGSPLPRRADGLPQGDGSLVAGFWAPVLAGALAPCPPTTTTTTDAPEGWRVGRALGRSPAGEVGWLESWYPAGG